MSQEEDLHKINRTSRECYRYQGPGVGAGGGAIQVMQEKTGRCLDWNSGVLEIGFGHGELLRVAAHTSQGLLAGVDIAASCITEFGKCPDNISLHILDVSHEYLPWDDDSFDFAFCTETIEHLSNPYMMVAEVKRVLKHGGVFTLSFPRPEDNLGYGGGQHAHVYPGFLTKDSFERFMKQLYWKQLHRHENGSSAWYCFENYKGEGIVDVFEVVSGNYDEQTLYGMLEE